MYETTQSVIDAFASTTRNINAKVKINADEYTVDSIQTLSFEDSSNPETSLQVGSTVAKKIELSLFDVNTNVDLQNARYEIEIGIEVDEEFIFVPLGIYFADEVKTIKNVTYFTLFDMMLLTETTFNSALTYPATITQIATEIANMYSVGGSWILPNVTIPKKPQKKTVRETLEMIAQLAGAFVKFDRSGNLTFKQYEEVNYTVNADRYIDFEKTLDSAFRVGKVIGVVTNEESEDETQYTAGTGKIELRIENEYITQSLVNAIYTRYNALVYTPVVLKMQGDPLLDVGDVITLISIDNEEIKVPIMENRLSFMGGLTSELVSVGESENKNAFSTGSSLDAKLRNSALYAVNVASSMTNQRIAEVNEVLIEKANVEELVTLETEFSDVITRLENKVEAGEFELFKAQYENRVNEETQNAQDVTLKLQEIDERTAITVEQLADAKKVTEFINTTITQSEEGLLISSEGTKTGVLISENRMSFVDDGVEVAYISDKSLKITHGVFVESAVIAGYKFERLPGTETLVVNWVGD